MKDHPIPRIDEIPLFGSRTLKRVGDTQLWNYTSGTAKPVALTMRESMFVNAGLHAVRVAAQTAVQPKGMDIQCGNSHVSPYAVKTEQQSQKEPSLIITLRQAEALVKFFGGHDCEVTVAGSLKECGEMEPGLYAWCTDYPEEGAEYLGKTEVDDDLAMHGRSGKVAP